MGHTPKGERRIRLENVLMGVGLLLVVTLPEGAGSVQSPILLENWPPYYQPSIATVSANTPVEWINQTPSPHSIRHDGCLNDIVCLFDSGAVAPDKSYTLTGLPPGRYSYHCELHPIMRGVLMVVDHTGGAPRQTGALR